jgi:hypothetical protein
MSRDTEKRERKRELKECKRPFSLEPRRSIPAINVARAVDKAGYEVKPTKKQNCNTASRHNIHVPRPHYTQDEKDCGKDFEDGVNHSTEELHDMASAAEIKGHSLMNRSNLCRSLINAGVNVSVGSGRPSKKEDAEYSVPRLLRAPAPRLLRRPGMGVPDLLERPDDMPDNVPDFLRRPLEGRRKRNSKRRPTTERACKNRSMTWVKRHKSKSNGKKVMVRGSCRKKSNRA